MTEQDAPTEVKKGLRFRWLVADEKVLFEVDKPIGSGYWECVALNETYTIRGVVYDGDYAGTRQALAAKDILGALRLDALFGGYDPKNYEPQARVV